MLDIDCASGIPRVTKTAAKLHHGHLSKQRKPCPQKRQGVQKSPSGGHCSPFCPDFANSCLFLPNAAATASLTLLCSAAAALCDWLVYGRRHFFHAWPDARRALPGHKGCCPSRSHQQASPQLVQRSSFILTCWGVSSRSYIDFSVCPAYRGLAGAAPCAMDTQKKLTRKQDGHKRIG